MAFTFANLLFELPGTAPGFFSDWVYGLQVLSAEIIAEYDGSNPQDPLEDFDTAWNPREGFLVTRNQAAFALHDGASIAFHVDGGAAQVIFFDTADFADISQATSIEVRDVLNTALTGATASIVGGDVLLVSDSQDGLVQATGGTAAAILGFGTEITFILENSLSETYVLSDGLTLTVSVDGGGAQTATFNTADFSNIALATAAEVVVVLNTDIAGATASVVNDRIRIVSDTARASVEMIGGTAQQILGFPGYHSDFAGLGLDTQVASYNTLPDDSDYDGFEREWAGRQAKTTTQDKEPFVLADLQTLTVKVDGGAEQTITFDTAEFADITNATAIEVQDEINNEIVGATATAVSGLEVILESDTIGVGSSIEITGGTAAAALDFYPAPSPSLVTIGGNEGYTDSLGGEISANFDVGANEEESFELDHGPYDGTDTDYATKVLAAASLTDNEGYIHSFTQETVFINTVVAGNFVITISNGYSSDSFTEPALATTSPTTLAAAFAAQIAANAKYVGTTSASGEVRIVRDVVGDDPDSRTVVTLSVTVPTGGEMLIGTQDSDGSLTAASYDSSTPEAFEDFEEEWPDNENFVRKLREVVNILTAIDSTAYGIRIISSAGNTLFSYTATVPTDTTSDIATLLAAAINAGAHPVTATPSSNDVILEQDTDTDVFHMAIEPTNPGDMDATTVFFDGKATVTEEQHENLEENLPWTRAIRIAASAAGDYTVTLNGVDHTYPATGAEAVAVIAQELETKVNASTVKVSASRVGAADNVQFASEHAPPAPFSVDFEGPSPGDIVFNDPDPNSQWLHENFLNTLP